MNPYALEHLLRVIASAALRQEPLPPALRQDGSTLACTVADRLDRGITLPDAIGACLPADLRLLLAGPRPGLQESALVAAESLRMQREARSDLLHGLLYPLCTTVACAGSLGAACYMLGLDARWLVVLISLMALLLVVPIALTHPRIAGFPLLGSWRRHLDRATLCDRAALCAHWRLSEERLHLLLGSEASSLLPVLANPDAEVHCRRLADVHRQAAWRYQRWMGHALQLALYLIAAIALLLTATHASHVLWQDVTTLIQDPEA